MANVRETFQRGEDDREMMMCLCIGAHEARTTMKWSFVSVREG